jgi:hypothetical protein
MEFNTRQASVVIGLTLMLTLPVTVVSEVGSQKKPESNWRYHICSNAGAGQADSVFFDVTKMTQSAAAARAGSSQVKRCLSIRGFRSVG